MSCPSGGGAYVTTLSGFVYKYKIAARSVAPLGIAFCTSILGIFGMCEMFDPRLLQLRSSVQII